ncbi:MAG: hypothetical protein M1828_000383 [Chrysothrix sp. TS-e1954]|nr:MAG: hypothetical protein M1828_000383 [Chrysothrix sp. TS-e1954]
MATSRTKRQQAVGSAAWVLDERQQTREMVDQEMEGFDFSARNEMEWLNEHMADIFSRTEFNVPDVYQTPGKLRGKPPRTARKRNPAETRAPLTDIFAPNTQARTTPFRSHVGLTKPISPIKISEDQENYGHGATALAKDSHDYSNVNTDSGYHEMTDNETEDDPIQHKTPSTTKGQITSPALGAMSNGQQHQNTQQHDGMQKSFAQDLPATVPTTTDSGTTRSANPIQPKAIVPSGLVARKSNQFSVSAETADGLHDVLDEVEKKSPAQVSPRHASSSSEASSPERPVVRKKSSLTFASLPAREPLATKKSVGNRVSQSHQLDVGRSIQTLRDSTVGKLSTGRSLGGFGRLQGEEDEDDEDPLAHDDMPVTSAPKVESETSRMHNKTSTQRLHERITMLGKLNPPQTPKVMSSSFTAVEPARPAVAAASSIDHGDVVAPVGPTEEEWIGPISPKHSSNDSNTHKKPQPMKTAQSGSDSTPAMKPIKHTSTSQTCYPDLTDIADGSTTPAGSPFKSNADGPLSAAKANFNSFLQSARSMFASSAATSAQAKLETMGSTAARTRPDYSDKMDELTVAPQTQIQQPSVSELVTSAEKKKLTAVPEPSRKASPVKKQRLSLRLQNQARKSLSGVEPELGTFNEHDKAHREESTTTHPVAPEHVVSKQVSETLQTSGKPEAQANRMANQGELRRPAKATKEGLLKARPAAVPIKLASQRVNQFGPSTATLGASLHDSLAPPQRPSAAPRQPQLTKKGSTSSLRTVSSNQSIKGTNSGPIQRPAALIAADRKKAEEEKEARRREDNKREIERKRAAKVEDEKRQAEEARAAEQQKAFEAKAAAQKQAAERQKAEAARKNEQSRSQHPATRPAPVEAPTQERERHLPVETSHRPEQSTQRPAPRLVNSSLDVNRNAAPHMNPAKPPKRYLPAEDDEEASRPATVQKGMQVNPQYPSKRRRTSEENVVEAPQRPTIGAPIRQSTVRKDPPNRFTHGFMNANPVQAGPSMLKTAVNTSHQMQHPKTPHMPNINQSAHTPFGEIPNPPQTQQRPNGRPPQAANKTPGTAHKSSPAYPNGDNISLPEINTDSEDSDDDDDGFQAPSWADSPALRELLRNQQLVDPMKVFGPIAPLQMEEVFKGTNKDRQARFRARTSSANWNGPDRLTDEERKRDFEARARLEKDGAWTFQQGS